MPILNPYNNIDWNSILRIGSYTHHHMSPWNVSPTSPAHGFDRLYNEGIRHFPSTHYQAQSGWGVNQPPLPVERVDTVDVFGDGYLYFTGGVRASDHIPFRVKNLGSQFSGTFTFSKATPKASEKGTIAGNQIDFSSDPLDENESIEIEFDSTIEEWGNDRVTCTASVSGSWEVEELTKHGSRPIYPYANFQGLNDDFTIPADALLCPSTESTTGFPGHQSTVGSTLSHWGRSKVADDENSVGGREIADTVKERMQAVYDNLLFEDAGGTTSNHGAPVEEWLDEFPDQHLGLEVYNDKRHKNPGVKGVWFQDWDKILSKGKRCWGFAVTDGATMRVAEIDEDVEVSDHGRAILLLESFDPENNKSTSQYNALRAYRTGAFYAQLKNPDRTGLKFTGINPENEKISVTTEGASKIRFVTEKGVMKVSSGNSAEFVYPLDNTGESDVTFVRVEAAEVDFPDENEVITEHNMPESWNDDIIFSQPIMYRTMEQASEIIRKDRIRKLVSLGVI